METEQTYGVVVVLRDNHEHKFLIIQHEPEQHEDEEGSWSFPKGHHEGNETPKETALREVEEETGITEVDLLDLPLIHEEYEIAREDGNVLKNNDYFIGFVKDTNVKIQAGEIRAYKWASFDEAMETFQYESRKEVLKKAKKYLENYGK